MGIYVLVAFDVSARQRDVDAALLDELYVTIPDDGGVLRQLPMADTEMFRDRQEKVLHVVQLHHGSALWLVPALLGGLYQQCVYAYQGGTGSS